MSQPHHPPVNSLDHYRLLRRSGLRVSPLSLGTMTFGVNGWGTDYDEADKMISRYRELGGNFIDTANLYANGESERMLGKLLKDHRQQTVCATKYSLRRLNTDYIDLLYLHLWDNRTAAEEILRAFDDLVRAPKLRSPGHCSIPQPPLPSLAPVRSSNLKATSRRWKYNLRMIRLHG